MEDPIGKIVGGPGPLQVRGGGRTWRLPPDRHWSVGRSSGVDIRLENPRISRLHAVLTAGPDGTWSVTDADSDNGLRVNGRDVPSNQAVPLRNGDRIHLGAWTVITITRG